MKSLILCVLLSMATVGIIRAQSLLEADSMIVVQTAQGVYTAMATYLYKGLDSAAIRNIYKERVERARRLKLQSALQTIELEEKANQEESKYKQATGDSLTIDSTGLDGTWTLSNGKISETIEIEDNQSKTPGVFIKVVSAKEILIVFDEIISADFYKQENNVWVGKSGGTVFKLIRDKSKPKKKK